MGWKTVNCCNDIVSEKYKLKPCICENKKFCLQNNTELFTTFCCRNNNYGNLKIRKGFRWIYQVRFKMFHGEIDHTQIGSQGLYNDYGLAMLEAYNFHKQFMCSLNPFDRKVSSKIASGIILVIFDYNKKFDCYNDYDNIRKQDHEDLCAENLKIRYYKFEIEKKINVSKYESPNIACHKHDSEYNWGQIDNFSLFNRYWS